MTAKILICAPSAEFATIATDVWKREFENSQDKRYRCTAECVVLTETLNEKNIQVDADAIVARGNSASYLRARFHDIPVIEAPMMGIDILHTLNKCKKLYPGEHVAIVGTENTVFDMQHYDKILDMQMSVFQISDRADLTEAFERVADSGINVVVGGSITCVRAQALGMRTVQFMSSNASIAQALRIAVQSARDSMMRQQELLRYQSMLDHINEGIVGVDNLGVIVLFNRYASEFLKLKSEEALGKLIQDVIPDTRLGDILCSRSDVLDELVAYDGNEFNVSKRSVKLRDANMGSMLHIQQVTKIKQLEERIRKKAHLHGLTAKYTFDGIIGESKIMRETIAMARIYSQVDSNILIEGDTGTGKELFAQSIHNNSYRRAAPFVAVNCAAIPATLLESELFGYVEGAFTGARKGGKVGLFELAHNGTIFLDEIYGLPMPLQGRLLRVLQEKEIMRVGDDKVIPVDVRVICATNRNLNKLIEEGSFRDDLYYRLDVLKLMLPKLSERGDDLVILARDFIGEFCEKMEIKTFVLPERALTIMHNYSWPGNVRELHNVCERVCVLRRGKASIEEIYSAFVNLENKVIISTQAAGSPKQGGGSFKESVQAFERQEISLALQKFAGNKTRAAEYLEISRATLWKKIREFEME